MIDGLRERMEGAGMKQALKRIDVAEHPIAQALTTIIAGIEHEQAAAVARCIDAAEMDIPVRHDKEERREELLAVAEAVASQDFRRYWFEEVVDVDKPERVAEYAGYDGEQWRDQLEAWYRKYRSVGVVETPYAAADPADVGHIAAMHVEETYGMELAEFVAGVINWSRQSALEHILVGPIQSYTAVIDRLPEEIERRDRRIAELEERVAELEAEQAAEPEPA